MSTSTLPDTSHRQAADSPWAVETHGLVKRFGEDYLIYKRNVPRWVPRWRPWDGGFRNQS